MKAIIEKEYIYLIGKTFGGKLDLKTLTINNKDFHV